MHIIKLAVIFLVLIGALWLKRPLYQAILAGILAAAVLYGISPGSWGGLVAKVFTDWNSLSILVILYLITFLQRILEKRSLMKAAQQDLDSLFHNRRVNAAVAPMFVGLLPSAAAMILCGDIVKESTAGYLDKKEQAFVTTWFRHIPESSLPTYSSVLLMGSLAGVPIPEFLRGMALPVLCLFILGYFPYIRRLPRETGQSSTERQNKFGCLWGIIKHLWTLLAILALILVGGWPVEAAVAVVLLMAVIAYGFRWQELKPMFIQAFEVKMQLNTLLILVFKEFLACTGCLQALPDFFTGLPIPAYLVFSLLFFFGGLLSGTNGIIVLGTGMAFSALPQGGMPLMVLMMCMCHAASQVSPTHICIAVAAEYYGVTFGDIVKKTLPRIFIFCALMIGYYQLLLLFSW